MSRSLTRLQAMTLGLVVLLGLGLAAAGLFAIGNRQWLWADTFHVQAGFRKVSGIEVGTRSARAGRRCRRGDRGHPTCDARRRCGPALRLDGKLRSLVRTDAAAQIVGEGMIGGKVIDIHPGSPTAAPVADDAVIASRSTPELTDLLAHVENTLEDVRKGQGTLGKLVKDEEAYRELLELMRQGKGTLTSIQQDADALKNMPILRNYVTDPQKLLVRPNCERNRQWFTEADLFEPGRAVLTAHGRQELDRLVPWLEGLKHKDSEVVVCAYADPKSDAQGAQTLTLKQSEAVVGYLKDHHAVQKMGWVSRRKVTPLGLGTSPPPVPERDPLPRRASRCWCSCRRGDFSV